MITIEQSHLLERQPSQALKNVYEKMPKYELRFGFVTFVEVVF